MKTKWKIIIRGVFLIVLVGCGPIAQSPLPIVTTSAPATEPTNQMAKTLLTATILPTEKTQMMTKADYARPEVLVDASWVADHLNDPSVRIIDARAPFKSPYYKDGHIPGAVFVEILQELCCPSKIMDAESFARLMGKLGVGDETTVVVYDTDGGLWAARSWWALMYYGHGKSKMLNGGLDSWVAAGKSLDTKEPQVTPAIFHSKIQPQWLAMMDDVKKAIDDPDIAILDALSRSNYVGDLMEYGRPGHITNALNFPAQATLHSVDHTMLSSDDLSAMLSKLNLDPKKRVITYCGGGYYGAHAAFVLYLMGYEKVSLYDGSLMEWARDPANPMETGQ